MAITPSDEARLYGNLIYNNLFAPRYDLYKIPGPPGYWLWGECVVEARVQFVIGCVEC